MQMDFLNNWDEIDVEAGLAFCGGEEEFLLEILADYASDDKRPEMQQYYESADWMNYQIVVHGLKGISLTVGLTSMSEAAKGLEFACKENRVDYIREHHQEVVDKYTNILEQLKNIL